MHPAIPRTKFPSPFVSNTECPVQQVLCGTTFARHLIPPSQKASELLQEHSTPLSSLPLLHHRTPIPIRAATQTQRYAHQWSFFLLLFFLCCVIFLSPRSTKRRFIAYATPVPVPCLSSPLMTQVLAPILAFAWPTHALDFFPCFHPFSPTDTLPHNFITVGISAQRRK